MDRFKTIDFLFQLTETHLFLTESVFTAVSIADSYIKHNIINESIHELVFIASFFISNKIYEMNPLRPSRLVFILKDLWKLDDLIQMEQNICKSLQFNFLNPTYYSTCMSALSKCKYNLTLQEKIYFEQIIQVILLIYPSFDLVDILKRNLITSVAIYTFLFVVLNKFEKTETELAVDISMDGFENESDIFARKILPETLFKSTRLTSLSLSNFLLIKPK